MPTFNTPMLTNAGKDLLGRLNAGKTSVSYTKTVFSSMDNSDKSDDDIKQMKDITPAEITTQPSTNYEDGNTVEIRGIGTNRGLSNAVAISTYATYAKDDSGNEIPFAIAVSQTPDYMPADSGQAITNLTFSILFTVQDTKNIKFNDPHNEAPTYQDIVNVNNRVDGIQGTIDDTLKPYDKRISDNSNSIKKLQQDTDISIKTALNQANGHSDNHYNDLSNKNNILSNDLKSNINTTNDLADKYSRSYYDAPNLSGTTNASYSSYGWRKLLDFPVEEGKKYWISAYSDEKDNWDLETVYDNSQSEMTNTNFFSRSFIADSTKTMPVVPYNDSGNGGNLYNICITQSDSYVPFEVAQRNKLWNDRITNKTNDKINSTKPHNLAPYYETSWNTWFTTHWGDPNSQVPVEKGKNYWFSCYIDNGKANVSSSEGPNAKDASKTFALQPDYYTGNYYANEGKYFICKWISDRNGNLPLSFNSPTQNGHRRVTKICVTQSENYIPYEETDSDTSVNELAPIDYVDNQISTKIDNGVNKSIQQSNENITKVSNNKVTDNHDGTIQINGKNQSISKGINKCDLNNITTPGTYFSSGIDDIQDYINTPTIYNKTSAVNNMYFVLTVYKADDMCFTQVIKSGDFKPYYRNHASDGWSQWYQLADTDYVDNQIASIKKNAWRELNIVGISNYQGGNVLCKINWGNNTAKLVGSLTLGYSPNKIGDTLIIQPSNDFTFSSNTNGIHITSGEMGDVPITENNGNLQLDGYNASYNNVINFYSNGGSKDIIIPIMPK